MRWLLPLTVLLACGTKLPPPEPLLATLASATVETIETRLGPPTRRERAGKNGALLLSWLDHHEALGAVGVSAAGLLVEVSSPPSVAMAWLTIPLAPVKRHVDWAAFNRLLPGIAAQEHLIDLLGEPIGRGRCPSALMKCDTAGQQAIAWEGPTWRLTAYVSPTGILAGCRLEPERFTPPGAPGRPCPPPPTPRNAPESRDRR